MEMETYPCPTKTLYPLLHRLTHRGYLKVREVRRGSSRRRLYRASAKGRRALEVVRQQVRKLLGELDERTTSRRPHRAG